MLNLIRVLKTVITFPFRAGMWFAILGIGVLLGHFGPALVTKTEALARSYFSHGFYDPQVALNPVRELEAIDSVRDETDPRLRKVEARIREVRGELFWLAEKSRLIEARVGAQDSNGETSVCLDELAKAAACEGASAEVKERFNRLGGPQFVALRERRKALEAGLSDLLRYQGRVDELRGKLETRRVATLRLAPRGAEELQPRPAILFPEVEEVRQELESIHEVLAKAVYSLAPELLQSNAKVATTSHASTP
jgi:hypothetical protein